MSTDSHDQAKPCKTPARSEEESAFDGKRIKKERSDNCVENGDAAVAAASTAAVASTATSSSSSSSSSSSASSAAAVTNIVEKRQLPAGRFASNGFHGDGDLLQDLVAAKVTTLANYGTSSKQDKIRIMIEDSIRLSPLCILLENLFFFFLFFFSFFSVIELIVLCSKLDSSV